MARRRRTGRHRVEDVDVGYGAFREYVPVGARRALALLELRRAERGGERYDPVSVEGRGRKIATTTWGRAWCDHIESYHDFANRLPRGRTYLRNRSVVDVQIRRGTITAKVVGSELYEQQIAIQPCRPEVWKAVVRRAAGGVGSLIELLEGRFSEAVMAEIVAEEDGLLPDLGQVSLRCDCPDWARLCKHLAAVLYGVGVRLDRSPELLFELRGVDPAELITTAAVTSSEPTRGGRSQRLEGDLGSVFGIDLDELPMQPREKPISKKPISKKTVSKKSVSKKTVSKKSVSKKTVRKKTVSKKPVRKKPVRKKPVRKKTVRKKRKTKIHDR